MTFRVSCKIPDCHLHTTLGFASRISLELDCNLDESKLCFFIQHIFIFMSNWLYARPGGNKTDRAKAFSTHCWQDTDLLLSPKLPSTWQGRCIKRTLHRWLERRCANCWFRECRERNRTKWDIKNDNAPTFRPLEPKKEVWLKRRSQRHHPPTNKHLETGGKQ